MSDTLENVWSADDHTFAKHQILQNYLAAWIPILSKQSQNVGSRNPIKYIDAFAGPGIYKPRNPGENPPKGSPLLAIESAISHQGDLPIPVEFIFIEARKERHKILCEQLIYYERQARESGRAIVRPAYEGDCVEILGKMLAECKQKHQKFGPALVFLDQFGYSSVPMELVGKILAEPQCEVLSYLEFKNLDRFITDETKHTGISETFGSEAWKAAIKLHGIERARFLQSAYMDALLNRAKATFVWPFAMLDSDNKLLYWLFFSTNNIRGLEVMKEAMWKVDQTGSFSFSDKEGLSQLALLTFYNEAWLVNTLRHSLAGRTMSVDEIREYVLTKTPCFRFRGALGILEKEGTLRVINPPAGRAARSFAEGTIQVAFEHTLF